MWQVVCTRSPTHRTPRRVVDRGPLQPTAARAESIARWLRSTGLYERVQVECVRTLQSASLGLP
jgi:hypothetical protein